MRPHRMIGTLTSLEDVMERVWEEPGDADENRILVSKRSIVLRVRMRKCSDFQS